MLPPWDTLTPLNEFAGPLESSQHAILPYLVQRSVGWLIALRRWHSLLAPNLLLQARDAPFGQQSAYLLAGRPHYTILLRGIPFLQIPVQGVRLAARLDILMMGSTREPHAWEIPLFVKGARSTT